jgi:hypothetical protein
LPVLVGGSDSRDGSPRKDCGMQLADKEPVLMIHSPHLPASPIVVEVHSQLLMVWWTFTRSADQWEASHDGESPVFTRSDAAICGQIVCRARIADDGECGWWRDSYPGCGRDAQIDFLGAPVGRVDIRRATASAEPAAPIRPTNAAVEVRTPAL